MKKVVLKEPLVVVDFSASIWKHQWLKPGTYQVEKVPNPTGMGVDWFVLQDTTVGTSMPVWQEYLDERSKERW